MNIEQHLDARLLSLRSALAKSDIHGAVVSCAIHIYYFTGMAVTGRDAFLVIGEQEHCLVLPDNLAADLSQGRVLTYRADPMHGMPDTASRACQTLTASLVDAGLSGQPIGVEAHTLPLAYARCISSTSEIKTDIGPLIEELCFQKDEFEIDRLLANQRVNDRAFLAATEVIRPGLDELALFEAFYAAMVAEACQPFCWQGCLGGGARSALPNPQPSDYVLNEGDLVLLDIFSRLSHYYSDSTRTFVVGQPDSSQSQLHKVLEDALCAGEELLKPDVRACDLDAAVRETVKKASYGEHFPHHVGHGLGLCQQERPFIVPASADILKPGCVIALEPGIYFPGSGGMRLENVYHITENGYECLTGTKPVLIATKVNH